MKNQNFIRAKAQLPYIKRVKNMLIKEGVKLPKNNIN